MSEQQLIDRFIIELNENRFFDKYDIINNNCKSKNHADIEMHVEINGKRELWRIEAKVETNADKHNSVHKIFGELLKETGRHVDDGIVVRYALLLSDFEFYCKRFSKIERSRFIGFGKLIPVHCVFVFEKNGNFRKINWSDLHADN